jgi:hypothetical protein
MIGRVAGSLAATLHGAGTHDTTVIPPLGNVPSRPRGRSRLEFACCHGPVELAGVPGRPGAGYADAGPLAASRAGRKSTKRSENWWLSLNILSLNILPKYPGLSDEQVATLVKQCLAAATSDAEAACKTSKMCP